ncbi:hypothetical protein FQN51_000837 [Onygenales sp. PD_10]|nr:hypothetical protein FQN51_000837 [Onygenales sp. PD_10]
MSSNGDQKRGIESDDEYQREANPINTGRRDLGLWENRRFIVLVVAAGLGCLEYGYDQGMSSGFQAMPGFLMVFGYHDEVAGWNMHTGPQQIFASFMLLGSFIASFLIGPIGSYLNRRFSIMLGAVLLIAAVTAMAVTTSFGVLYFARILMGISNGFLMSFTMVYVQEIAPPQFRGLSFGLIASWITIGTTIGYVIISFTEKMESRLAYQIPLYSLYGLPAILVFMLPFFPESPRWLLLHGKEEDALKSLRFIRHTASDEIGLRQEFEEMRLNIQHELEAKTQASFFDMFRGSNLRRTLIVVGVGLCNPGVGAMFILAFKAYFLKMSGVQEPFKWTIISNCIGLLGLVISWYFITKVGRRQVMIFGASTCGISMLLLAIITSIPSIQGPRLSGGYITLISVYLFGFNFGLAAYTYLVAGELPAQNLRGHSLGLSTGCGFVFAWLTTFTAPYFVNPSNMNWGGKYGYIWAGSTILVVSFLIFGVPEVRGRSLEEIEEMFNNNVPTRKFPSYVTQTAREARERLDIADLKGEGFVKHVESVAGK